jgi:outer membrane protein OmpA-like peptidoglycan-associated protein
VDIVDLTSRIDGLSTASGARPARMDMKARVGDGLLSFAGTIGPIAGPLRLDLQGELREFAVPRTNPYLLNGVAWEARNGWLTTNIQCRIDGDNLQAKADVLVSRLQLARAGGHDEARARIGLPLGMIASLMKDRHGDIRVALPIGGRVNDPRFHLRDVIWSTLRNAALKAVTGPVSLIGRVKSSADARIERIEIDPIRFEPGTSTPTPEGQEQLTRLVAFLDQTPETRLTATAVVSRRDLAAMKQPDVDAVISRAARDARISPEAAAARLFQERFPEKALPETSDAIRAALLEGQAPPADALATLADKRLEAVRATIKKAKIDTARLLEDKAADVAQEDEPQVRLDLAESENARPPGRRAPEFLRRLTSDVHRGASPAR